MNHSNIDVIIVGAGAAGGAAAYRLASAGIRVVCIEQGDWHASDDLPATLEDWEILRQTRWNPNPNIRREAFDNRIDDSESAIKPLMFNGVGGSTIMWSCHFPRFHPSDFASHTLDGVGDDWPLSYDELSPYYALNEKMMGVSGLNGNPAYPVDDAHRLPPLPLSEGARQIATAFNKLGWSWWPADLAINSSPYGAGRGACNHCGPCEMNCPHKAKATTDIVYWPQALKLGAQLIVQSTVKKVITNEDESVSGVIYTDRKGDSQRLYAPVVMLAANAVGTARLLLLSANKKNPNGLANSSGLVGKRLMLHPLARVTGLFDVPVHGHTGLTAGSFVSHHFYETDPDRGFLRGFKLQAMGTPGPAMTATGGLGRVVPWGASHHHSFERYFSHAYSISICSDDMPQDSNRVELSDAAFADDGLPIAKMVYKRPLAAKQALGHGRQKATQALEMAGCYETIQMPEISDAGFHLMGTAKMGNEADNSVLDRWGESHDITGLFVIDGAAFVTAAAVNPTNTIQALALRAADQIIEKSNLIKANINI